MPFLNREQILTARDVAITVVPMPEWGEGAVVGVRVMTGRELHEFSAKLLSLGENEPFNQRTYVCALTLCDESGGRLFSQGEVDMLAEKNSQLLERLYDVACQVNLLRDADREAAKKNALPADASGSGLPDSLEGVPFGNGKN